MQKSLYGMRQRLKSSLFLLLTISRPSSSQVVVSNTRKSLPLLLNLSDIAPVSISSLPIMGGLM